MPYLLSPFVFTVLICYIIPPTKPKGCPVSVYSCFEYDFIFILFYRAVIVSSLRYSVAWRLISRRSPNKALAVFVNLYKSDTNSKTVNELKYPFSINTQKNESIYIHVSCQDSGGILQGLLNRQMLLKRISDARKRSKLK